MIDWSQGPRRRSGSWRFQRYSAARTCARSQGRSLVALAGDVAPRGAGDRSSGRRRPTIPRSRASRRPQVSTLLSCVRPTSPAIASATGTCWCTRCRRPSMPTALRYDIVVMLQPTSPLRAARGRFGAIRMLVEGKYDSVWSVSADRSQSASAQAAGGARRQDGLLGCAWRAHHCASAARAGLSSQRRRVRDHARLPARPEDDQRSTHRRIRHCGRARIDRHRVRHRIDRVSADRPTRGAGSPA